MWNETKILILLLLTITIFNCFAFSFEHKKTIKGEKIDITHWQEFQIVFAGYGNDESFKDLARFISSGIDDKIKKRFEEKIGKLPDNHRILAHPWGLSDKIPQDILNIIKNKHPGMEEEFITIWKDFVNEIIEKTMRVTGLPKAQAKAFAALIYDIHLIGDIEPGNTRIDLVMNIKKIVSDIKKNVDILFKNKPKYAQLIKKYLDKILKEKISNPHLLAEKIMTILFDSRIGTMLDDTLGTTLKIKHTPESVITANTLRKERTLEMDKVKKLLNINEPQKINKLNDTNRISKIQAIKSIPKKVANFAKNSKVKFVRGLLQEHKNIKLQNLKTLSVPVAAKHFKVAGAAGVMTLVFTEGITVYKFANGNISEEQFIKESAKNCGAAIVTGSATWVIVALGATPTGWAVIGVGITADLMYEVAFKQLEKEFSTPTITMDDLLIKLPTSLQRRRGAFNNNGFEDFFETNKKRLTAFDYFENKKTAFDYFENKKTTFDYFENKKTAFDIGI